MRVLASTLVALVVICAETCYGAESFVGEVYFVVDDKAVQVHMKEVPGTASYAAKRALAVTNLKKDIAYLAAEANKLLATLNPHGLNLELRMRGLNILDTNVFPSNDLQNGYLISGYNSLQYFSQFLTNQKTYATYKQDLAVLFTGFDLSGDGGPSTVGIAQVGTICDPSRAIAVVEYTGTYVTAETLAHEVIHIFGGSHDGIASSKVMASSGSPQQKNRWEFGQCAATDVKEFIEILSSNCLLETNTSSVKLVPDLNTYNGLILNPDTICQRTLNDTRSYMCMLWAIYNNTSPKGDTICQYIYCSIPGTGFCKVAYPSEGMICDKNKRCNKGKCQADSSSASANIDTTCVLGNQKSISLQVNGLTFNGNCPDFIAEKGQEYCYNSLVSQLCCATCNQSKTGIAGCDYGDRSGACKTIAKATACSVQNKAVCCSTCHGYVGKRSTPEDTAFVVLGEDTPDVVDKEVAIQSENKTIVAT
jgi:hypothetical protein